MPSIIAEPAEPAEGAQPTGATVSRRALLSCAAAAAVASPLRGWPAAGGDPAASSPASPMRVSPLPARSPYVGANLSAVRYWTTQFPFADLVKQGSGWSPVDDKGARGGLMSLRPDGYPAALQPGQRALLTVASSGARYPIGRYAVSWDGKGSIDFPLSRVTVRSAEAQRIVFDVTDNGGPLNVAITSTQAADPVRNLRVLWPGTEATHGTQAFNPAFLEKIAPFSLLRFMDWGGTNASPLVEWADRPQLTDPTYGTAKGVPVELMVDLANTLRADPWFCVPHQASDDYVRQLATLLHTRLDPSLRPYIEYSNEVWNQAFPQAQWAAAQSDRLGLPRSSGFSSAFYAQRSVEVFKIFAAVYGADRGRLVRVIAGQAVWTRFQEGALAWQDTAAHVDVLAIAPYFKAETAGDPKNVATTLAMTSDQLLDDMLANIRGRVASAIRANAALSRKHGLRLTGYEGGTHDTCSHFPPAHQDAMVALLSAAHRHPRMREVYAEYLALWIAGGGDLLAHYTDIGAWSKYGLWGSLEHVAQAPSDAPKYQALLDVIARHPRRVA